MSSSSILTKSLHFVIPEAFNPFMISCGLFLGAAATLWISSSSFSWREGSGCVPIIDPVGETFVGSFFDIFLPDGRREVCRSEREKKGLFLSFVFFFGVAASEYDFFAVVLPLSLLIQKE